MTADDERRFFSLLRAGLWDKDVELCLFGSPVDWQSLLEQGRKQTVLGVLADGIGKLPPPCVHRFQSTVRCNRNCCTSVRDISCSIMSYRKFGKNWLVPASVPFC